MRKDVDDILAEKGMDALLLYSESFKDENMYYLTRFLAPDPYIFLKKVDGEPMIIINSMEYPRAKKESTVPNVRSYIEYNFHNIVKTASTPELGVLKFITKIVKEELSHGIAIYVPQNFPSIVTDALRNEGLSVNPMFNVIEKARETKDPEEIEEMRFIQRLNEEVTMKVIDVISNATIGANSRLLSTIEGKKELLTVEKIKGLFGRYFLEKGAIPEEEIIVACGPKGSDPHYHGDPQDVLRANQPIVIDVYPRNQRKRYWSDMTRTIVKGKAPLKIRKMFETVLEAKHTSTDAIRADVLGSDVNNICFDVLEKAGYNTIRGGRQILRGFTHSLGHGLGLQVHEGPRLNELYTFPLEEHNVVTVEPGLYDPDIGGVRIEDVVVVQKNGCENITNMEILLEV